MRLYQLCLCSHANQKPLFQVRVNKGRAPVYFMSDNAAKLRLEGSIIDMDTSTIRVLLVATQPNNAQNFFCRPSEPKSYQLKILQLLWLKMRESRLLAPRISGADQRRLEGLEVNCPVCL
jgi:hypothetical protein